MIHKIRKSKLLKVILLYLLFSFTCELFFPSVALAFGGPGQPETQSFEPAGNTEMVDLFTGDFTYNIPLLDVGGYPVNLSYHSGITMDQEASWVGLGWNINPGVVNRNVRGLPDDFDGDILQKDFNIKPNKTFGVNGGIGAEIFGIEGLGLAVGLGVNYNNYKGYGAEVSAGLMFSAGDKIKGKKSAFLGVNSNSDGTVSTALSFSRITENSDGGKNKLGARIGASFNGRTGLKTLSIGSTGLHIKSPISYHLSSAVPTYFPEIGLPQVNTSVNLSLKAGTTFFGVDGTANLGGYYSEQRLESNSDQVPAYGYLNVDKAASLEKAALDFNREKDGAFTVNTSSLPLTNMTYDIFSVSGQGIGGAYRPHRNDIGYVFDSQVGSTSDSYSLGFEIGGGNLAKGGIDITVNDLRSNSGKWENDNAAIAPLKALQSQHTGENSATEKYYFKQMGEKNVDPDISNYSDLGTNSALKIKLQDQGGMSVSAANGFVDEQGKNLAIPSASYKTNRQKRNQPFSFLTKDEAAVAGLQKDFYTSSVSSEAKGHHIAEVTTLRPDGTRYIYGIPAYNIKQEEVAFSIGDNENISALSHNCSTGLVENYSNQDNSVENKHGIDNFYSKTTIPAYAHAYLLTAVLSPDYVDMDGVTGPSNGDLGTYTKFKYKKFTPYKWKVPASGKTNAANYNEGLKTDTKDDQASYLYGEKELWYLERVESKNYVAVFNMTDRDDALGVTGPEGTFGGTHMQRLNSIMLYAKPADYEQNGLQNAVLQKQVNFEYDYSLCNGTPNSRQGGKLTLKKVYFTNNVSGKGKLSPYQFSYSNNVSYSAQGYDRWGNYKSAPICGSGASNADFPYALQDAAVANSNASAWNLTKIQLPSGGDISVGYESDDYGYVQNRQAMQMFRISGLGSRSGPGTLHEDQKLYFKIPPISAANAGAATQQFFQKYLNGLSDIYFKCLVDIGKAGSNYEYVPGYAKFIPVVNGLSMYGVEASAPGKYDFGWIQLKNAGINDGNNGDAINPIRKAALLFGRINMPKLVWDQPAAPSTDITDAIKAIATAGYDIDKAFRSPNKNLRDAGYASALMVNQSWLRLLSPDKKKLGGGCRVKSITVNDHWGDMATGGPTGSYTQDYNYETFENGVKISSGVASYEPIVGGEENPFRQPIAFGNTEQNYLTPGEEYYTEEPLGESFYPSAVVGYGKVTVQTTVPGVTLHGTGSSEYTFYTAKDFPTLTHRTTMDALPKRSEPIFQLFYSSAEDNMTVSQGFAIETNDMHGKPKSYSVFAEAPAGTTVKTPVSSVEYTYQLSKTGENQLDNKVATITPDGTSSVQTVGIDYDLVTDFREESSQMTSTSVDGNLAGFLAFIFPIVIPTVFPTISTESTRFRSASTTKVINRSGILSKVKTINNGSAVTVSNLVYDSETGEPVLTQSTNEFNDFSYSLNYPAHWGYKRMGPAYQNLDFKQTQTSLSGGTLLAPNAPDYFVPGDELLIHNTTTNTNSFGWVTAVNSFSATVINADGTPASANGVVDIKVVRSGRRNQQTVSIGSLTALTNPIGPTGFIFPLTDVVDATAVEFSENWKTFCDKRLALGTGYGAQAPMQIHNSNPYVVGLKGNWRLQKKYVTMGSRTQSTGNNTNTRTNGTIVNFTPFWTPFTSWVPNTSDWTLADEIKVYTPYGSPLGNKDAIKRATGSHFEYNSTLPGVSASNARYSEIGFDSFEDYDFAKTTQDDEHFTFKNTDGVVISSESHSGKKSIKITSGKSVKLTKPIVDCGY